MPWIEIALAAAALVVAINVLAVLVGARIAHARGLDTQGIGDLAQSGHEREHFVSGLDR
jgi:hypothetical protein